MEIEKEEKVMKLEIINFVIKGFRNISSAQIELNDVTAIVGLNGYGKSNLITAIDFGIEFIKSSPKDKTNQMAYKNGIPLLNKNAGMDYSFEIEAKYQSLIFKYGYTFSWRTKKNNDNFGIKTEYLRIKETTGSNQYNTYISRNERSDNTAFYKSSPTARCTKKLYTEDNELALNKLLNIDKLFFIEVVKEINEISFYIEKHLDSSSSYLPDPFVGKSYDDLSSVKNIPRTIWQIKSNYSDKYAILIDSFKQLFPSIEQIDCKEIKLEIKAPEFTNDVDTMFNDYIYTIMVKDNKMTQPISFDRLSDGTKRVFLSLTFALLAEIKGLSAIVFEEPENSIHPSLLQAYLRVLHNLSGKCKIIFTSHSPYMIQYLSPEDIYIGLVCKSGQADFRKISNSNALIKRAEKEGQLIGELIFNYISFSNANEMLEEFIGKPAPDLDLEGEYNNDDDDWFIDLSDENVEE